jgi:hypothetical protein
MKKPTEFRRMPGTEFEEHYLVPKDIETEWNCRVAGQNRLRMNDPRVMLVHVLIQGTAFNNLLNSPKEYAKAVCDVAAALWDEMLDHRFVALDATLDELDTMCKEDFGVSLYSSNDKLGF